MASHLSTPASVLEAPTVTQTILSHQPDPGRQARRLNRIRVIGSANQPYVRPEPKARRGKKALRHGR